jgi:hypothetical protein
MGEQRECGAGEGDGCVAYTYLPFLSNEALAHGLPRHTLNRVAFHHFTLPRGFT